MIRRLWRWLLTGSTEAPYVPLLCDFCKRNHHVHDVNSGRCLYWWCECGARR